MTGASIIWRFLTGPVRSGARCVRRAPPRAVRRFGTIRRLPSGRYQAFYVRSGARVVAQRTFRTKTEAGDWLAVEAVRSGAPSAPLRSALTVREATEAWIASRRLAPLTEELYRGLVTRHWGELGAMPVAKVTTQDVAAWLPPGVVGAKAYRLLASVMRQLVADGVIPRSPCTIRGAGTEHTPERPVISVPQAMALAEAMAPWGVAVHLAAWAHLRRGEVLGLDWSDIEGDVVHVRRARVSMASGREIVTTPKTPASYRMVTIPAPIADLIGTGEGPVVPLTVRQFKRHWSRARAATGIDIHFHDLRHSGLTWVAAEGATLAELMARAGHGTAGAALRYQHATRDRDRALAAALGRLLDPSMHAGCTSPPDTHPDQG